LCFFPFFPTSFSFFFFLAVRWCFFHGSCYVPASSWFLFRSPRVGMLFAFSVPIVFLLIIFSLLCSDWLFLFFSLSVYIFPCFLLFLVYFYFFLSVFSSLFLFGFLPYFPFPSRVFFLPGFSYFSFFFSFYVAPRTMLRLIRIEVLFRKSYMF
jgi:hypothetical protein